LLSFRVRRRFFDSSLLFRRRSRLLSSGSGDWFPELNPSSDAESESFDVLALLIWSSSLITCIRSVFGRRALEAVSVARESTGIDFIEGNLFFPVSPLSRRCPLMIDWTKDASKSPPDGSVIVRTGSFRLCRHLLGIQLLHTQR
jgi:hypothetical protein